MLKCKLFGLTYRSLNICNYLFILSPDSLTFLFLICQIKTVPINGQTIPMKTFKKTIYNDSKQ